MTTGALRATRDVRVMDGNKAAAWAVLLCRPDLLASYPISPQTPLLEQLYKFRAEGRLDAETVEVEGENSALSAAVGAAAAGGRAFTATSSMDSALEIARRAVETRVYLLWEADHGRFRITHPVECPRPIDDFVELMGRFRHLRPAERAALGRAADERYRRIEALCAAFADV